MKVYNVLYFLRFIGKVGIRLRNIDNFKVATSFCFLLIIGYLYIGT